MYIYIMTIIVKAQFINKYQFGFKCPFCFTKYKKNGDPYKNAKHIIHKHGSNGNLNNRVEHRFSHCYNNKSDFLIEINNETIRQ